jgi:hypothetical protein
MNNELINRIKDIIDIQGKINTLNKMHEMQRTNIFKESIKTAIIVEPRKHRALSFVLRNILENLDNTWNIILYHGTNNKEFAEQIISGELFIYSSRLSLVNLNIESLKGIDEYNKLLLNKEFILNLPTEIILIFQTDSMINSKYKDLIHTFIEYEYVGAPWNTKNVGNGGFSLRRRSKMLECLDTCKNTNNSNEDVFYSMTPHNLHKPPFELAKLFAIETVYSKVFFGVHNAWKYHSRDDINEMCNNCSGLSTLIKLQSVID